MTNNLAALFLIRNDEYFLPYALEATRGFFKRYVIYNSGSTDNTSEIIRWFINSFSQSDQVSFFVRDLPDMNPRAQGPLRNSMIAESLTDWQMIIDGDEVYSPEDLKKIIDNFYLLQDHKKLYGIVRRIEIDKDLKSAYGLLSNLSHHRLYHRTAIFTGNHPGEGVLFPQNNDTQLWLPYDPICYHFHNCLRSSKEHEAYKRVERKSRYTYTPGKTLPFDLFEKLPILKTSINNFPVNPELKLLQERK